MAGTTHGLLEETIAGRKSARHKLRVVTNRKPERVPVAKRDYSVIKKLVNDFLLDWVKRRQVAESTRSYYVANLHRFLKFCRTYGVTSPKLLTPEVARHRRNVG